MRAVICTTTGCGNQNIPILIPDDNTPVACGVCGQWIIRPEGT